MEVEFDVKINAGDLYDYMMHHNYTSFSGLIGNIIGALMVVAFLMNRQWIFLIVGIIILLYLPWTLFLKSRQQALTNPAFRQPLHYKMTEEGIYVSQGEECQMQAWADMYKAVSTPRSIIVYTSMVNASVFPKRDMGDARMKVIEMISTHMSPGKVKIRG